ncbi:MAG TPA: hypothetical protein PKC40_11915 [Saprospiraceae bacterium]|nr:hypothetical protein [Saprospiraceae bacterium]
MNAAALLMMVTAQVLVTGFTAYFFYKVLTTPPKADDGEMIPPVKSYDAT